MLNSFLTIGEQIFIVFLLMAVGYIGGKTGLITNALADGMSLLVMNIAIPASIIMAFQREFESRLVHEFLLSIVLALLGYVLFLTVAFLTIRDKDRKRRNTLIFTAVFANCAMVALPLQSSLFGADGVFCGAVAVAMFGKTIVGMFDVAAKGASGDHSGAKTSLDQTQQTQSSDASKASEFHDSMHK